MNWKKRQEIAEIHHFFRPTTLQSLRGNYHSIPNLNRIKIGTYLGILPFLGNWRQNNDYDKKFAVEYPLCDTNASPLNDRPFPAKQQHTSTTSHLSQEGFKQEMKQEIVEENSESEMDRETRLENWNRRLLQVRKPFLIT